jgi:Rieske Fe-S protein
MNDEQDLTIATRRRWVKQFMLGTVATLSGPRWLGTVLAEVSPTGPGPAVVRLKVAGVTAMIENDVGVLVPVAVLAVPGGSVQYSFNTGFHPFTLNRVEANRFVTLDSVCTHNGCAVGRYKAHVVGADESVNPPVPILANLMKCPCHGSRYDIEGRVIGGPAQGDLARFETTYDAATDIVCITIPNLSLHISSISVHQRGPGETIRLKLVIPVTAYSSYEICHQSDPSGSFSRIPFATTATGPAGQTVLFATTDGEITVYVDAAGTSGFFVAGLLLDDVPT